MLTSDELKQTINDHYRQFAQFLNDGKPSQLAETHYTEDAKFYPPNGGVVEGKEGIMKVFEGMVSAGLVIAPEAHEVEVFGDHAYEYGVGIIYKGEEQISQQRYICIWKNIDGQWKIYRDFVKGIEMQ